MGTCASSFLFRPTQMRIKPIRRNLPPLEIFDIWLTHRAYCLTHRKYSSPINPIGRTHCIYSSSFVDSEQCSFHWLYSSDSRYSYFLIATGGGMRLIPISLVGWR